VSTQAAVRQEDFASPDLHVVCPTNEAKTRTRSITGAVDREALRDVVPILMGIAPFAMVIGAALGELDISPPMGIAASALIYAGSAQLAAMDLLTGGAGLITVLLTVAVINARMLVYGAALEPMFRDQPAWFRWIAPQFIVDQTYALAMNRPELAHDRGRFRRYWLTIGGAIGVVWLGMIGTTLSMGPVTGSQSPLDFAATALFIGTLVPKLSERRAWIAAAAAALVTGLASTLPNGIGLLAGILAGMTAGSFGARRLS
jgi:predicted branched-subunit amino acid permease